MDFGPFGPFILIYGILAVRLAVQLVRNWGPTWDRNFTSADRALVDQAAFFLLLPVAVLLHEVGHAVAVTAMGGTVLDWGYYGFAGWVAYDPTPFSPTQQTIVAAAGTVVNILLAALALALVFLKKPPMRAAFNQLLIQFVIVSLLNALVLYPVLDLVSNMNGDWMQMYFDAPRWFSLLIVAVQIAIVGGLWWLWKNPAVQARVATLTGQGAPFRPVATPRRKGPARRAVVAAAPPSPAEALLSEAADRVASGWLSHVDAGIQRTPDGAVLALQWSEDDLQRAVVARAAGETLDVIGVVASPSDSAGALRRQLRHYDALPDADRLTLDLRVAMETVDAWTPAAARAV